MENFGFFFKWQFLGNFHPYIFFNKIYLFWNFYPITRLWGTLKKLGIETVSTFIVISKTVTIYNWFEKDWNLPWLHEYSLPIRLLAMELFMETYENIDR